MNVRVVDDDNWDYDRENGPGAVARKPRSVVSKIQGRLVCVSIVADASVVAELGYLPAVSADLRSFYTLAHDL